ncbi:lysozyme inhibitor LprI family protein [Methylobacterium sp. A54F]
MIPKALLPALGLLLAAAEARAASFPCDRAQAPDERAVCAHLPLNDLDVEMAVRFAILKDLLPMGGRDKLREDQEAWLRERAACAADTACLTAAYEARLGTMRAVFSEFAKQGPQ